jgi:hypothetical protein
MPSPDNRVPLPRLVADAGLRAETCPRVGAIAERAQLRPSAPAQGDGAPPRVDLVPVLIDQHERSSDDQRSVGVGSDGGASFHRKCLPRGAQLYSWRLLGGVGGPFGERTHAPLGNNVTLLRGQVPFQSRFGELQPVRDVRMRA